MFVGGVSLAGEDSQVTAHREVAEELGLHVKAHLSKTPLLSCVVCTAYNRCFVVLYSYTMNPAKEVVKWQAEEVAWGSFVPYTVIEAAADRSIQRFVKAGTWPGSLPAIQSPRKGMPTDADVDSFEDKEGWKEWDFVPDGLLVWEAWLRWLDQKE